MLPGALLPSKEDDSGLLVAHGAEPAEPVFGWLVTIEAEVIPCLAAYSRWAERLFRRRS